MEPGAPDHAPVASTSAPEIEPIVGFASCKLLSQGAEAVREGWNHAYRCAQLCRPWRPQLAAAVASAPPAAALHRRIPPLFPPPPPDPAAPRCPRFPRQRVWETTFCGRPAIVKQRFSKKYRHPTLDAKLTVTRLKQVGEHLPRLLAV